MPKFTKEEAGFREIGLIYKCKNCVFWRDGNLRSCLLVKGDIPPEATCILWNSVSVRIKLRLARLLNRFYTRAR